MKYFFLIPLLAGLFFASCRSHKESTNFYSGSMSVDKKDLSLKANSILSDFALARAFSCDSIIISVAGNMDSSDVSNHPANSLSLPDLPYGLSNQNINIKAYNLSASASASEKDSLFSYESVSSRCDSTEVSSSGSSSSSVSTRVYDPPDVFTAVIVAFLVGATILIFIYLIKRKVNP